MATILHVGNGGEQNIILPPGQEARHRPMFVDGSTPFYKQSMNFMAVCGTGVVTVPLFANKLLAILGTG